jgi:deoxyadenosine/deoxycytidine kinase
MVMHGCMHAWMHGSQTEQTEKREAALYFDNSPSWNPNLQVFFLADRFNRKPK